MTVEIQFLGASGTVTGSKYLVKTKNRQILVDAGMFQGQRSWREKNWEDMPFAPNEIDAVLITHSHLDHIGMLPRYVARGLKADVYLSKTSAQIGELILLDSGRLQEEEAEYRRERNRSRHKPPLPLYTEKDARLAINQFKAVPFAKPIDIAPGVRATWLPMGHIIGAGSITLEIDGKVINFSGDIGRYSIPVLKDPQPVKYGDLLLIESTYGDRLHEKTDPKIELANVINLTHKRGGVVLIPSFAVGRAQHLLFVLRELKAERKIPHDLPVIIDSPMASDATKIYSNAVNEFDQAAATLLKKGIQPFSFNKLYFTKDRSESIKLNGIDEPMVIISASGMLSGGRILHHLKNRVSDPRTSVLLVGFQPPGSRGDWLKSGAESMRLFGEDIPVRADVFEITSFSAHADRDELLRWCRSCEGKPGSVAVVHGEPESAKNFSTTLHKELSWNTFVPQYQQKFEI